MRADDPNDRIPHELRRDLRGRYALWAWLDHVDVKEQNTLDMWVADPEDPARHYVKHYQLDFGQSLGAMAMHHEDLRNGHEYVADHGQMLASLASAGIYERSWESREASGLRGVGLYDVDTFDPGSWKPNTQAYAPLLYADRFDNFWAAKIAIRFTREELSAIVEAGRLTDPRSAAYLVETLVARQRATARYWFDRVAPLADLRADEGAVCFDDLAIAHDLVTAVATRYAVTVYDGAGHPIGTRAMVPATAARTCTAVPASASADGYTMMKLEVVRPRTRTALVVHLARDPITARPRVIGLWRL